MYAENDAPTTPTRLSFCTFSTTRYHCRNHFRPFEVSSLQYVHVTNGKKVAKLADEVLVRVRGLHLDTPTTVDTPEKANFMGHTIRNLSFTGTQSCVENTHNLRVRHALQNKATLSKVQ